MNDTFTLTSAAAYLHKLGGLAVEYAPKILLALIVLIVGFWVASKIGSLAVKALDKRDVDASLKKFINSIVSIILKILVVLSVVKILGVETASFVAIIAAAGFAIGLALQGSLANFAGGALILALKPFKVGDFIEAVGFSGSVDDIQVFYTVLRTPDNRKIVIPNGKLSNDAVTNYTAEATRRLDMSFGIGYSDDIGKAKSIIKKIIEEDKRIHTDPEPLIAVGELADSSVNITVRVWCATGDYWGIHFDIHEKVKLEFDAAGVSIPFPQTDVHLFKS